jgi:histidinol-phosphate/aromatic aminotransferase/cobyric acid decarboxylase-like protein/adenosyl cobinamide kinase/adenosyl cobinamide phosphate guanylyltransferase
MALTLILGGTRSGKSERAEELALASGNRVHYVATAEATDRAMAARIAAHTSRRPTAWRTTQAADELVAATPDAETLLIDGLGVWIAGVMHRAGALGADPALPVLDSVRERVLGQVDAVAQAGTRGDVIVAAEQAGEGVLPRDECSRAWLDLLGDACRRLAARATHVELVVAGRPLVLTGGTTSEPANRWHGDRAVRAGDADHAVNVMTGGPPAWMRRALEDALVTEVDRYPDEGPAVEALAMLHDRSADEIVPTNGATEALWLLPAALRPRLAVCVQPIFGEADAALSAHGVNVASVIRDPERGFALDPAQVPTQADLVVLGNPGSPCGTLHPAHAALALRRPGRVVVVDEAFMDLVPGEPGSLAAMRLPDVIVLRSLTKSLALPGLRVGYALAPPALAQRLRDVRPAWSCNALALAALSEAARRPEVFADAAERARGERDDLSRRLDAVEGVRQWPGAANYILVQVPDGPGVLDALRRRRIAVRSAATFPGLGANHLRLTARDAAANAHLVAALADALAVPDREAV